MQADGERDIVAAGAILRVQRYSVMSVPLWFRQHSPCGTSGGTQAIRAMVRRKRASDSANSTAPITASHRNGFHTTSIPAPR